MADKLLKAWLDKYGTTTFDTILGYLMGDVTDTTLKDDLLNMSEQLRVALEEYVKNKE